MANQAKSLSTVSKHFTKAEISARQEAEARVVNNATEPIPNATVKSNKIMKKIFKQICKLNDSYTEADSVAVNTLAYNLYLKEQNERKLLTLDIEDDNYERFMTRLEKFNKQIDNSMKQLCIPLNARLTLANDMAKVMIEEQKLEQMSMGAQPIQEVNPMLQLLEALKQ